ncbi:hypothetical protein KKG16_02840, partial [Patescibacteria group bacterium]|nr:hypothetical protein [Patescibacteria group bacterium]
GNHTETSPKAPDLDRDAVLPVNHLPPEMVKPTDVRTEPKEPSQNATQVEKPATASRPEKQAPAPQEKVEEIPQKTDQNPPGQKPPTSDPDTPHTN